jgi:stage V sporulation protein AD
LKDTQTIPGDYDMILTGDLGATGSKLLIELLKDEHGLNIEKVHRDCGTMIYDLNSQDVHSGGSGCGCSASVVCSYILDKLKSHELKNVLFVGTGALLSPTSSMQKESIPGIAHGVLLKA